MANIAKFHNRLGLEPVSADPASPSEGELQYSDGTHRTAGTWEYNGTSWVFLRQAGSQAVNSTSSATYNATSSDNIILCDTTSNDVTVNLPAAASNTGLELTIKKIAGASNKVIVDGNASETIDGQTTIDMPSVEDKIVITSDGTNWISKSREILVFARYTSNSGQTINNSSTTTVVYEDLEEDTHGMYNTGTGVITFPEDGLYNIKARLRFNALSVNAGELQFINIFDITGATTVAQYVEEFNGTNAGNTSSIEIEYEHRASATDTMDIRIFQNSGASGNLSATRIDNMLTIKKIRE